MAGRRQAGHLGAAAAALLLTVAIGARSAPSAWQGRGGGGGGGPVLVPAAASSILRNAEPFLGKTVTVTATVEAQLTPTAFTVDQDKTKTTGELLVLVPTLQKPADANTYVTVIGEVVMFDPAAIGAKLRGGKLDLPAAAIAKFTGKPAVVATSVVTAELEDVAKVPPPPLTPEEESFDAAMKRIQPASGALRTAVTDNNTDAAKQQADILKAAFAEVEAFFKKRNTADAVGWAQEAQKIVETTVGAAAVGRWDEATTSIGTLTPLCQQCHAAHRVRLEDGTFRVKPQ